jgi:predicted phage-related endonuclease
MTLSAADEDYRIGKVTGSLVNILMNTTNEAALNKVWREKVGLDPPQPTTWAMKAGSHMEPLILDELELRIGHAITRRGEIVDHPTEKDACVKLDGQCIATNTVYEAKFLGSWRTREDFIPAYAAQVHLQMMCTGARNGVLVVAQGTSDPVEHEILFDEDYAAEMMRRVAAFLECMRTLTPPFPMPPIIPKEKWRTVNLDETETNWGVELKLHLDHYAATAEAAQLHGMAGSAARKLIPDDVGKVLIGQWQITRDKRGTLSIRTRKVFA